MQFEGVGGKTIHGYLWETENAPKAIVQIAHGMAEHGFRYERFAKVLNQAGFTAVTHDHRGHGKTAGSLENVGYLAEENGWQIMVEDMYLITKHLQEKYPDTPIFLFGHSMGSFVCRDYIGQFGNEVSGVILSATAGHPGILGHLGVLVAKFQGSIWSKKKRSYLLNKLSFEDFNKLFKPNRTGFDWLSRDEKEVDKYVEDPYCGGVFSAGFFQDMLGGILKINAKSYFEKTPKALPILLIGGEKDPVGDFGKGVLEVFEKYQKAGSQAVSHKIYPETRHELLNETNRVEITADILKWLNEQLTIEKPISNPS